MGFLDMNHRYNTIQYDSVIWFSHEVGDSKNSYKNIGMHIETKKS